LSGFHRVVRTIKSPFELWIGNNDIFERRLSRGIQRITRLPKSGCIRSLGNRHLWTKNGGWRLSSFERNRALESSLNGAAHRGDLAGYGNSVARFLVN